MINKPTKEQFEEYVAIRDSGVTNMFILWNYNPNSKGGKSMLHIKFEYADELSNWEWRKQECICESLEQCKKFYGLGVDCDYRIISIEEVK